MKIAVVGAGVSGLVVSRLLSKEHEVTLYEHEARLGGHSHTIDVGSSVGALAVDTGFMVFNDKTYPGFCRLLGQLGIPKQETSMSFSVTCEKTGLEYNGTRLATLFARRRNALSPGFWRMLADILRFNEVATRIAKGPDDGRSLGEFLSEQSFGPYFVSKYLLPIGGSIWSCSGDDFMNFPLHFLVGFMANHGMLTVNDRPQWYVIPGGSRRYVEAIRNELPGQVRASCPVSRIRRGKEAEGVELETGRGRVRYDEVVIACHADQALGLLEAPTEQEASLLEAFPYQANPMLVHTDTSVLPRRKKAWASWNFRIAQKDEETRPVPITYNLNILASLRCPETYCATLNDDGSIDPAKVIRKIDYMHPRFTMESRRAQGRHRDLIRHQGISYCGAYWGYGFHEDGLQSALRVAESFGVQELS